MSSIKGLVLVLALALTQALLVSSEDNKSDLSDAAKEKIQQALDLAKDTFAKAGDAINQARQIGEERLVPLASNFTRDFKERFNDAAQKAQEVLTEFKETVSSHVSPFVNKVRKGMLDGVRNLRDKLNNKNKTVQSGEGEESGEKNPLRSKLGFGSKTP
ncbi:hypothetical protein GE061_015142 [Apolygus lucorum]|uniref:Uncharacterized protein n=1 Tax=Apolygus lucorum TaxID=248454 RepID=A0A8S9XP76_APOLU|nr:hypothetical protein GE061_015142 [Apolygus lucorum]